VVSTLFSMSTTLCMKLFITSDVLFRFNTKESKYSFTLASSFLTYSSILRSNRSFRYSFMP
jgi:hypothetical protein